jgi:hypothetical protein
MIPGGRRVPERSHEVGIERQAVPGVSVKSKRPVPLWSSIGAVWTIWSGLSGTLTWAWRRIRAVLRVLAVARFLHVVFVIGYCLGFHLTTF